MLACIGLLLLEVGADEGLAATDLSALSFFACGVVPHPACAVVGIVGVVAVGAGDGVVTDGESFLPILLVDVRSLTLFAGFVVFSFIVGTSALAASDGAVGVNFVAEFPAM